MKRVEAPRVEFKSKGGAIHIPETPDFLIRGDPAVGYVIRDTLRGVDIDKSSMWGVDLRNPIAEVIRFQMTPGRPTVIAIDGDVPGPQIGGTNPNSHHSAFWQPGQPVRDVAIVGTTDASIVRGITLMSDHGAPDEIWVENVIIQNTGSNASPLWSFQGGEIGRFRLYNFRVKRSETDAYDKTGLKWGCRMAAGRNRLDFRNGFFDPCLEHSLYGDGLEDSYFVNLRGGGNGRTFFMAVSRSNEYDTPARGNLLLESCLSSDNHAKAGGGSDFTFVGHLGKVNVRRCGSLRSKSGSLVCWTDAGHGAFLNRKGRSTTQLLLEDFTVDCPEAERAHIQVSGCGKFQWNSGNSKIVGNKTALDLWPTWGGDVNNNMRRVNIPAADWQGWQGSRKVRYAHERDLEIERVLTDDQIDRLSKRR